MVFTFSSSNCAIEFFKIDVLELSGFQEIIIAKKIVTCSFWTKQEQTRVFRAVKP